MAIELSKQINKEHELVLTHAVKALEHARNAGELLIQAKDTCKHGEWGKWLESNFNGSSRQAQRYMRVHQRWPEIEAKATRVSDFSLRQGLKMLSSRNGSRSKNTLWSLITRKERVEAELSTYMDNLDFDQLGTIGECVEVDRKLAELQNEWNYWGMMLAVEAQRVGRDLIQHSEVGQALKEIRDKKLYRNEFSTFAEYCEKRWDQNVGEIECLIELSEEHSIKSMRKMLWRISLDARPLWNQSTVSV